MRLKPNVEIRIAGSAGRPQLLKEKKCDSPRGPLSLLVVLPAILKGIGTVYQSFISLPVNRAESSILG